MTKATMERYKEDMMSEDVKDSQQEIGKTAMNTPASSMILNLSKRKKT
jgi:hypothetical protein